MNDVVDIPLNRNDAEFLNPFGYEFCQNGVFASTHFQTDIYDGSIISMQIDLPNKDYLYVHKEKHKFGGWFETRYCIVFCTTHPYPQNYKYKEETLSGVRKRILKLTTKEYFRREQLKNLLNV